MLNVAPKPLPERLRKHHPCPPPHGLKRDTSAPFEQGERLRELGCEVVQGYGIARPMPATEIPRWLAQWQAG